MADKRKDKLNAVFEDYLLTIYKLSKSKSSITPGNIRKIICTTRSNVSNTLKTLADRNYIQHVPYGAISLTRKGRKHAKMLYEKNLALQMFFKKVLDADDKEAFENACNIEHVLSDSLLLKLKLFFDFMEQCPRNEPYFLAAFKHFCQTGEICENCDQCATSS